MAWLAFDIGGANVKIADGNGFATSIAFPLWQRPAELTGALTDLVNVKPHAKRLAVTMTGELADCFQTKSEGVIAILHAVEEAADGREILVYLCNGEIVLPATARAQPLLASASNWHVLSSYASRYCRQMPALLIDVGSTTTDFIPLNNNGPKAIGMTDPGRLATGELVYTGVQRSPVCSLTDTLPWRGELCGVAQELFATTTDVYTILEDIPEDPTDTTTADGRPRTKEFAHARIARMICADRTMFDWNDAFRAAQEIRELQLRMLERSLEKVLGRMEAQPRVIVLSGHGEFLARQLLTRFRIEVPIVSLSESLGPIVSRCAPAHALAVLARERAAENA